MVNYDAKIQLLQNEVSRMHALMIHAAAEHKDMKLDFDDTFYLSQIDEYNDMIHDAMKDKFINMD